MTPSASAADAYATSLGHVPDGPWRFDDRVSACFEDMLERSIPEYEAMRAAVFEVGQEFVQPQTEILDLGCSHGSGLKPFLDRFGAQNRYVLADESEAMLGRCREMHRGWIDCGCMRVLCHDLRQGLPGCRPSLILSVLTLQFIAIEHRQRILEEAYQKLIPGGALVLVEKVMGHGSVLDQVFRSAYYRRKAERGYSPEEIEAKRKSLAGVLVPMVGEWNQNMLRSAGFSQIDCFWRWFCFAGWVAVK